VLALPVVFAPIDLFLRNSGAGARIGVLLVVMLATFGGAAAGHVWVVHRLQKKIGPHGVPRMGRMADAMGLSAAWLIGAAVVAVVLTLLVAGLTSSLAPPR
jgi:Na+/melibiose symporter-like transporter